MDLSTLGRGDGIVVKWGSRGSQYAIVCSVAFGGNTLRCRKWLARGKRWTERTVVRADEVLRRAKLGEYHPSVPLPSDF